METPSDCVYYPLYYYLHNSIQKHPNSRLVWPKPQNRKSGQRTAHYMVGASLLSSHHSPCALFFFLSSLPTTQRGLCRGKEFYRSHPLNSLQRASLPLLFFRWRALFSGRIFIIIVIVIIRALNNKAWKSFEEIDHSFSSPKITPAMDTKISKGKNSEWDFFASEGLYFAKHLFNLSAPGRTGCSLCSWSEYW